MVVEQRWRKGTLHHGKLDWEGTMWTLARRNAPLEVLKEKLSKYIEEGQLEAVRYDDYVEVGAHSSFWYLEKLLSLYLINHSANISHALSLN